ncbi:hypothetical protein LTR16_006102, partial [Cryomyces antarcticus]
MLRQIAHLSTHPLATTNAALLHGVLATLRALRIRLAFLCEDGWLAFVRGGTVRGRWAAPAWTAAECPDLIGWRVRRGSKGGGGEGEKLEGIAHERGEGEGERDEWGTGDFESWTEGVIRAGGVGNTETTWPWQTSGPADPNAVPSVYVDESPSTETKTKIKHIYNVP